MWFYFAKTVQTVNYKTVAKTKIMTHSFTTKRTAASDVFSYLKQENI